MKNNVLGALAFAVAAFHGQQDQAVRRRGSILLRPSVLPRMPAMPRGSVVYRGTRMVTSSDAEIQAHNDEVCTRQVIRRLGRPWKMKRAQA